MPEDAVVIVGAGLAGYTLARELRKLAPSREITLVTADSGDVYSKPMLSNALAQGFDAGALVQVRAGEQAEKLGLRLLPRTTVTRIDPVARVLDTHAGPVPYARLALALGARPRRAAVPGAEHLLSINHLDDYAKFRARLAPGAHVCLLGAGLVGCEFANDLAASGYRVTLVEQAEWPLGGALPAALAARLRDGLVAQGVRWLGGRGVAGIVALAPGYRLELADGQRIEADLLLSAIGLEAETTLAAAAGLDTGRGIRVDACMTTSAADIHALGDCVEIGGRCLPYVLPLMQQARALAATLAGTPTRVSLPALPVVVKTPACPLVLCPPPAGRRGAWHAARDDAGGAIYHYREANGGLLGFALAGDACKQRRQLASQVPPLLAD